MRKEPVDNLNTHTHTHTHERLHVKALPYPLTLIHCCQCLGNDSSNYQELNEDIDEMRKKEAALQQRHTNEMKELTVLKKTASIHYAMFSPCKLKPKKKQAEYEQARSGHMAEIADLTRENENLNEQLTTLEEECASYEKKVQMLGRAFWDPTTDEKSENGYMHRLSHTNTRLMHMQQILKYLSFLIGKAGTLVYVFHMSWYTRFLHKP